MNSDEQTEQKKPHPIPAFESMPEGDGPMFFTVAGITFFAQSTQGPITISLLVPTKVMRQLPATNDELELVCALLEARGQQEMLDRLDDLEDAVEGRIIAKKYMQAFAERQQARMGEAFGSSTS